MFSHLVLMVAIVVVVIATRQHLLKAAVKLAVWLYGHYDIRARWLAHYLLGDGSPLHIPEWVVREAFQGYSPWYIAHRSGRPFKFYSQTTLFWLVGTMTYRTAPGANGGLRVYGVDRYDWHPNRLVCQECGAWGLDVTATECLVCGSSAVHGEWWWSPTAIPGLVARILRLVWPEARDYIAVGDTGHLAISNGFWPFLGGKEFESILDVELNVPYPEMDDDEETILAIPSHATPCEA